MKKHRLLILCIALILVVIIPVTTALLLFEKQPFSFELKPPEVVHATKARKLAKRIVFGMLGPGKTANVSASEEDLNSLMVFGARTVKQFSGQVTVDSYGLYMGASLKVHQNPFGSYINIFCHIPPSDNGLKIGRFSIGKIKIPEWILFLILRSVIDFSLGDNHGKEFLDGIKEIKCKDNFISVTFVPVPDLKMRVLAFKERLKIFRDKVNPISKPSLVQNYYLELMKVGKGLKNEHKVSLSHFMRPLFELAERRSLTGDPVEENRAAILALSIYAGDYRFETFIGNVRTDVMKKKRQRVGKIVLNGRRDLRLHFIISAGMKVLSNSGVSLAVGEFKELMDAAHGGSGFSFVDLAADRAGVHFAETAMDKNGGAVLLQSVMAANFGEKIFFPDVSKLPEGISQLNFERSFGNVENKKYIDLVEYIDRYITQLPVHGGNAGRAGKGEKCGTSISK